MDLIYLFGLWVSALQLSFLLLPLSLVMEWRKRGTTEGFSAVMLVLPLPIMSCWMRYGYLTGDSMMVVTNSIMMATSLIYLAIFMQYTKDRTIVYKQIGAVIAVLSAIFFYVSTLKDEEKADSMGKISGVVQNARIFGALYQIKTVIDTKTTEYMPYPMQFAMIFFISQMTLYAVLSGNYYMAIASIPGILLCLSSIALYIIYPPITWRVPILGVQRKVEKSE
ncbi:hypothetical protein PFISCL1PPCAC_28590 [Pristionchus fissidentatus]|uniref:Sugar transporter SWEET n=1 Tax=Pristionchus fissidentatus TaxID=1538716 RepID=A0AAV5X104_9BILA|nr:hypothetical protein PFISCL1PPCAC_15261 [Pristionchus fissidentatus]GMT37293.1 hypothetical protein PFISCL1PPCAC_28590 [Pristionchus fissidentatus]